MQVEGTSYKKIVASVVGTDKRKSTFSDLTSAKSPHNTKKSAFLKGMETVYSASKEDTGNSIDPIHIKHREETHDATLLKPRD